MCIVVVESSSSTKGTLEFLFKCWWKEIYNIVKESLKYFLKNENLLEFVSDLILSFEVGYSIFFYKYARLLDLNRFNIRGNDLVSISMILRLDFRIVPTVWYF